MYEVNNALVLEELDVLEPGPMGHRLQELISRRMPLAEINEAFDLLRNGEVKRSVIVHE